ncbi:MAG: hypothetical protein H6574_03550 [Lewinellaceae bacterium]|nr:hypothetical protein [Saprospiraceae bacterium]MCB9330134.1 hypothetical protein [Lewinellaceae bacterium]
MDSNSLKSNFIFALHFFITALAWVAPFLFSWQILVPVYVVVLVQFAVFGRCLMNEGHNMEEADDATFYSHLFEKMGFQPNRTRLKFYVRKVFYPVLSVVALIWQLGLGNAPLLF